MTANKQEGASEALPERSDTTTSNSPREGVLDELSNWLKTAYGYRIGLVGWNLPAIPDWKKLKAWHAALSPF